MHNTSKTQNEHLLDISQAVVILMTVLMLIMGLALAVDTVTERTCLLLALLLTLVERYIAVKKYHLLVTRYVNEKENHNELLL